MATRPANEEDLDALARQDWRQAHEEARRRVAERPDDEKAALQLRDLIRSYPPRPRVPTLDPLQGAAAEVQRADALLELGDAEQAEVILRDHLSRSPRDVDAMRLMAQIAAGSGFPDNARKILLRSLDYDPGNAENWFNWASRSQHGHCLEQHRTA